MPAEWRLAHEKGSEQTKIGQERCVVISSRVVADNLVRRPHVARVVCVSERVARRHARPDQVRES
eukprot:5871233-Pleurochrysis_carterae.AAC.1